MNRHVNYVFAEFEGNRSFSYRVTFHDVWLAIAGSLNYRIQALNWYGNSESDIFSMEYRVCPCYSPQIIDF